MTDFKNEKTGINVFSGFDGMSCGNIALSGLGGGVNKYYASEIKTHAIAVTQEHFPNTIQLGDISKIKATDLEKIDLFIGGSPCQDFSQANKTRLGTDGVKSGLFWEYVRLLKEVKEINPSVKFFLENVKMKKEHEAVITNALGVAPVNINSKLVSPQLRNRFYWTNITDAIEQPCDTQEMLQDILLDGFTDRDKARALLESDSRPLATPVKMFHRYYAKGFTTLIFKDKVHFEECKNHYNKYFNGLSAKEIDTLLKDSQVNVDVYDGVRYMYKQEREILQGVPSGYTETLTENEAACLLGDGWNVPTIKHIFGYLKL